MGTRPSEYPLTLYDLSPFQPASFEWHDEEDIPGFKEAFLRYLAQCEELSYRFVDLMAEAFGLKQDALRMFFDPVMEHRTKVRACAQTWPLAGGYQQIHRWSSTLPSTMWIQTKALAPTSIPAF